MMPPAATVPRSATSLRLSRESLGRRRDVKDRAMRGVAFLAAALCVLPLAAVLVFVTINGAAALNLDLLTKGPNALGIGSRARPAVLGPLQMVPLASPLSLPS